MSNPLPPLDPFAPDAPLIALMALRDNPAPFLALSHEEQLAVVRRLRTMTQQPVTLKSEVARDGEAKSPKRAGVSAAKKALLDSI